MDRNLLLHSFIASLLSRGTMGSLDVALSGTKLRKSSVISSSGSVQSKRLERSAEARAVQQRPFGWNVPPLTEVEEL